MAEKWQPRVGNYTHDQTIDELGYPDTRNLDGEDTILTWKWIATGSWTDPYGNVHVNQRNRRLSLVFGKDKVLKRYLYNPNWKP